jgi:hypothetical protein
VVVSEEVPGNEEHEFRKLRLRVRKLGLLPQDCLLDVAEAVAPGGILCAFADPVDLQPVIFREVGQAERRAHLAG